MTKTTQHCQVPAGTGTCGHRMPCPQHSAGLCLHCGSHPWTSPSGLHPSTYMPSGQVAMLLPTEADYTQHQEAGHQVRRLALAPVTVRRHDPERDLSMVSCTTCAAQNYTRNATTHTYEATGQVLLQLVLRHNEHQASTHWLCPDCALAAQHALALALLEVLPHPSERGPWPGQGTWSVFAERVVAERDAAEQALAQCVDALRRALHDASLIASRPRCQEPPRCSTCGHVTHEGGLCHSTQDEAALACDCDRTEDRP